MKYVYIGLIAFCFWMCGHYSSVIERFSIDVFTDLDLNSDCKRLSNCLAQDSKASFSLDLDDNRCIIRKGNYLRRFRILELRGSLRACELVRNQENLGRY